jgi:hypothetical protein
VRHSHRVVAQIVSSRGVIVRRAHPDLAGTLDHLLASGELVAVLPGVYAKPPGSDLRVRVAAVMAWDPDAVLVTAAAARLWFWPTLPCSIVEVALPHRAYLSRPGFSFVKRSIPAELVTEWSGIRMTVPALTALDLSGSLGGDAIDVALRTGQATLDDLRRALELTAGRRGNLARQ